MTKESSVEKLPESNLRHLVGWFQAATQGGGDGRADGARDRRLDLASEGRNDDGTNDPENDDLGQCGEKWAGRQYACVRNLYVFSALSKPGASGKNVVIQTCPSQLAPALLSVARFQP